MKNNHRLLACRRGSSAILPLALASALVAGIGRAGAEESKAPSVLLGDSRGVAGRLEASAASCPTSVGYCVTMGTTTLTLSPSWLRKLASAGIRYHALAPATLRGNRLVLPIARNPVDPRYGGSPSSWSVGDPTSPNPCLSYNGLVLNHRGGLVITERGSRYVLNHLYVSGEQAYLDLAPNSVRRGTPVGGMEWLKFPSPRITMLGGSRFRATLTLLPSKFAKIGESTFTLPAGAGGSLVIDGRFIPGQARDMPTGICGRAAPPTFTNHTVPYSVRVEFQHRGVDGTTAWVENFKRIEVTYVKSGASVTGVYSTNVKLPASPSDFPGNFTGTVDFLGGHGYPPGSCTWTASDHIPADLDYEAHVLDTGYGAFSAVAHPLFRDKAQLVNRCGKWVFGATYFRRSITGTPQDPSADVTIQTGVGQAFAAGIDIVFQSRQRIGHLFFPLDRMYARKSFVVEEGWTEGDVGGHLRVTFKRLR